MRKVLTVLLPIALGLFFFACEKEVEVEVEVSTITVNSIDFTDGSSTDGGGTIEMKANVTVKEAAGTLEYLWVAAGGSFVDATLETVTWNAPDDSGAYKISVHVTDGMYIGIGEATVGVGMLAPTAATYYKGAVACGTCHTGDGTGWKDKSGAWEETAHASASENSLFASCDPCHSVGFNGLDEQATGNLGYDEAPIEAFNNVQCENCHGAGSEHMSSFSAADITVSFDAQVCGDCHKGAHHPTMEEWSTSAHSAPTAYPMGRSSCQGCHEGVSAAYRLSGDLSAFYASGTISRIGNGGSDVEPDNTGFGCATCHDPHDATNEHQLRTTADVQLVEANGASPIITEGGAGKLCMQCHHARRSGETQVVEGYGHFGPHASPQADMLTGNSAYEAVASVGFAWASPSHAGVEETCVTCHMNTIAFNTALPDSSYTGHEFNPRVAACAQCHGEIEDFEDIMAFNDFDGNGTADRMEDEVDGLMHSLETALIDSFIVLGIDTTDFDLAHELGIVDHIIAIDSSGTPWDTTLVTIPQSMREAGYNLIFVEDDGSHGFHNPHYAIQLLQQSYKYLTGSLPAGAAPLNGNDAVAIF